MCDLKAEMMAEQAKLDDMILNGKQLDRNELIRKSKESLMLNKTNITKTGETK